MTEAVVIVAVMDQRISYAIHCLVSTLAAIYFHCDSCWHHASASCHAILTSWNHALKVHCSAGVSRVQVQFARFISQRVFKAGSVNSVRSLALRTLSDSKKPRNGKNKCSCFSPLCPQRSMEKEKLACELGRVCKEYEKASG